MSYIFRPVVLIQNLFLLVSGFVLLVLAGDKLVETSVRIAQRWKIPASVIAVTLIAAGTSAPEMVTSFIAGYQGISDISLGNVIGSNTFNILAIGGLTLLLSSAGKVQSAFFSWPILLGGTGLFFYVISDLKITLVEGGFFLLTTTGFIIFSFFKDSGEDLNIETSDKKESFPRTLIFFIASFIGLVIGAQLALSGGVEIGKLSGLSERVIAITIISVGTGLPELATSLAASLRGHNDIAIGNIIGSNIFNTLAIPGVTASFFPMSVNEKLLSMDSIIMTGATITIGITFFIKNPIYKKGIGTLFIFTYLAYVLNLIY